MKYQNVSNRGYLRIVIVGLCLAASVALPVSGAGKLSPERQQTLLDILSQDCGSCHGLTRAGGLGPAIRPQDLDGKSVDFLTYTILQGRPGTAMPPWKSLITPQEARFLATALKTTKP